MGDGVLVERGREKVFILKVKVVNLYSASRVHASNALGLVTN